MIEDDPIWDKLNRKGLNLRPKGESLLMILPEIWQYFVRGDDRFMTESITTIGDTIWYPDPMDLSDNMDAVEAEIDRADPRFSRIKHLMYFFFPVPIFFAYSRWVNERTNFVDDLRGVVAPVIGKFNEDKSVRRVVMMTIESVVDLLWSAYGYTWPKFLMRRYFWKQLALRRN